MTPSTSRRAIASTIAALGLAATLGMFARTAHAQTIDELKKKGEITVGLLVDFPPFFLSLTFNRRPFQ